MDDNFIKYEDLKKLDELGVPEYMIDDIMKHTFATTKKRFGFLNDDETIHVLVARVSDQEFETEKVVRELTDEERNLFALKGSQKIIVVTNTHVPSLFCRIISKPVYMNRDDEVVGLIGEYGELRPMFKME